MSKQEVLLSCRDLSFRYSEKTDPVFSDLSLTVKSGETVLLMGPSGCGKSTLAYCLAGLYPEYAGELTGEITLMGRPLSEYGPAERAKAASILFQNPDNQIIANVVEEDVAFGPENIGVPTREIWRRVDESLKAVGMTAFRKKSPNKLSGGQKQRVAIAGVMAMKPDCIILDEPTAMLDPHGREDVIRTVHELNKQENITVVLITHYMEEDIDADRIIVMDEGKVVMDGTPKQIFSKVDQLKKYRLDVPQVTELAYELKKEGIPLEDGILTIEELVNALCQ